MPGASFHGFIPALAEPDRGGAGPGETSENGLKSGLDSTTDP
jgi:hypothetical protein